jgi:uncharacterized protein YjiS (DUF1127 family)
MHTTTLSIAVPVSRTPARRLADALREAWHDWQRRREERRAVEGLLALDEHTLRDIGAPAELRALAEARQATAYARMNELLR